MNKIELYNHNQETYENIMNLWKEGHLRVGVVQATGTGKSYLIGKVSEGFANFRVLTLAPRTHILNNLKEVMIPNNNCIYMTYSKLHKMSNDEIKKLNPDLIILDEFHRCGSNGWGLSVDRLLKLYSNAKVLGTTATNIRYLDNHRDMATEIFDNCLACKSDLSDAINQGVLPMPLYVTSLYSVDEEVERIKKRIKTENEDEYKELTDKLDGLKEWNSTIGVPNILRKYIDGSTNKFIVFCKNKKHLEEAENIVYKWFKNANIMNDIKLYRLIHQDGKKRNEETLREFRNGDSNSIHLLFSIDILNEGIHIDSTGVILLRETSSPIVFFQQIGRALSVGDSNKPIIFDFVNNFNSLKGHAFKNSLTESRNKILLKDSNVKTVDFTIYDETKCFRDILNVISESILGSWDIMYEQIYDFYKKNGHTMIPRDDEELAVLYRWASKQRVLNNKGLLSSEQIDKLSDISFVWNVQLEKWMANYNKLVEFYEIYGGTKIPYAYDKNLNAWCATQRHNKNKLSTNQIELLDELGFQWNVLEEEFEEKIKELKEYKLKYGDVNVPRRYSENQKLSNWVHRMRTLYDEGSIPSERITILEELGFIWNVELHRWNLRFGELSDYYLETKDYMHRGIISKNKSLKDWIARQRQAYRRGRLSEYKIEKLKSIGFMFEVV